VVLGLLLGESVALCLGGSVAGALAARVIFSRIPIATVTSGMLQRFLVTPQTLAICAGIGLGVGLIAAGLPAWRAASRRVVDALREA